MSAIQCLVQCHTLQAGFASLQGSACQLTDVAASKVTTATNMGHEFRLPFWGSVVLGEANVPKNGMKLKIGRVFGVDIFIIADDTFPCAAWSVKVTQDAQEATMSLGSEKMEIAMPYTNNKGASVSIQLDPFYLKPMNSSLGTAHPIVLCRMQGPCDSKSHEKATEAAVQNLKRKIVAVHPSVDALQQPDSKRGKQSLLDGARDDKNVPFHLKHILT